MKYIDSQSTLKKDIEPSHDQTTDPDFAVSINQIPPDYEDDDYENYFTEDSLREYLVFLEDDNLFKIYLVDEDNLNLKEQQAQTKINEQLMLKSIKEVESSTHDLQKSLEQIEHKF